MIRNSRLVAGGLLGVVLVVCVGAWLARPGRAPAPGHDAATGNTIAGPAIVIDDTEIGTAGFQLAAEYTGPIADQSSLRDLRVAIERRGTGALAALNQELAELERSVAPEPRAQAQLYGKIGRIQTYLGNYDEALAALEQARRLSEEARASSQEIARLTALLGLTALRRGEVENCIQCVGPASCIFPLAPSAVHTRPAGSRQAIEYFREYLQRVPGDARILWALNLAYMTLGEYPDQVPPDALIPFDSWTSSVDVGRFENVAPLVGLDARGPNEAGGSAFDDFTGDGLPDLFTTSLDSDRGASFFVNRGDGKFAEHSDAAGLGDQVYALNVTHADFDDDGNLDILMLRGGWEMAMRLSLLRNQGDGTFEDVTIASGLGDPIRTESAVWGDYDNDGLLDLFVCGEFRAPRGAEARPPDPFNVSRLYHNAGDGRFVDVAAAAGVDVRQCSKGSAWGDFDGDGWLDLFVSNMNTRAVLYHNDRNGAFREVTVEHGTEGPSHGFSCWFWDYDNDGRLDLYVNDYTSSLAEYVARFFGVPPLEPSRPRLYRNAGERFVDLTVEAGLDRIMLPMGCNFGDIDNDGFLDIYLGCGRMSLEGLMPNLMFWNDAGRRFADVTVSSGSGHLQKGHGVSFADWDGDGDLDLFVEAGGAVPGDRAYNALFRNPGHGRHWLKVKLVGVQSNRAGLGARIQAVVSDGAGRSRSIYRTVGNNASFGGNPLVQSIGLSDATRVEKLIVSWPASGTTQAFDHVAADQEIEITEGAAAFHTMPRRQVSSEAIAAAVERAARDAVRD